MELKVGNYYKHYFSDDYSQIIEISGNFVVYKKYCNNISKNGRLLFKTFTNVYSKHLKGFNSPLYKAINK